MAIWNFFLFLLLPLVHARNYCPMSYCENGLAVRFPFWLQGDQQPQNCGPIGFNLSCNGQKKTILSIPYNGDFHVSSIYYYIKRVVLNDSGDCLARRLLSSDLSFSPFIVVSYQNYTFLSCPKGQAISSYVVDCLGNGTTDILVIKYDAADAMIYPKCKKIVTLPLPVSSTYYDYRFPSNFELTWDVPETGAENNRPVTRITALSFVVPTLVIIVGISCCIRICMMRRDDPQAGSSNQTSSRASSSDTVTTGLDEATIESYRKITIGESRQVEGPNDVTCIICLAEYVPDDTIRFMPECQHCFHVECIDKWLSMKAKCPICRN